MVNKCSFFFSFLSLFHTTRALRQRGNLPPAPSPPTPLCLSFILPHQLPWVLSLEMRLLGAGISLHLFEPCRK